MSDMTTSWHTWREIHAQPDIWRDWEPVLAHDLPGHLDWIDGLEIDEIWLSGAGTSAYIGDIVADAYPRFGKKSVRAVASTDIVANPAQYLGQAARPLIVNFGRSGNSAESIGVLDAIAAIAPDTPCLNITCNPDGTLAQQDPSARCRVITLPERTHDAGFAMTSSFSTMVLTALSLFKPKSAKAPPLADIASAAVTLLPEVVQWAKDLPIADRIVFVGTGPLRFAAREAALKVLELSAGQIPALWDSSLGFRHGPKSFMTDQTVAVVMCSGQCHPARYDIDLLAELRNQFPAENIFAIGPNSAPLTIPSSVPDEWATVLHVLVAQVLGVVWAARLGLNVDDPFQGQGTLSRVVSGVKLYSPDAA